MGDSGQSTTSSGDTNRRDDPAETRWLNRRVLSWAAYDVGSSAYFSVVPPVLFPVFFLSVVSAGERQFLYLGLAVSISFVIAGCLAPFAGRWADRDRARWPLLAVLTLLCCLAVGNLAWVGPGDVLPAIVLYVIAQTTYLLATPLYESLLTAIAPAHQSGRVSGFGWALGFAGGIAAILAILSFDGDGSTSSVISLFQNGFLIVAAIYATVGFAALIGLRKWATPTRDQHPAHPTRSVWQTLRGWRQNREAFKFILAFYLINDAIVTVALFAAAFLRSNFGATIDRLLILLLIYHLIAIPAALAFGHLADRWNHRGAIGLALVIWVAAPTALIFGQGAWVPFATVILLALVTGPTQAMLRSTFSQLVPRNQAAEFFGFNAFAGRVSAAVGPLLYGAVAALTGNERAALGTVFLFVLAGILVLVRVRIPAAGTRPNLAATSG